MGRRRQVVDEKYTRPQGLYVHKDVDIKKLRKLILESKLAPCYPGDEECCSDLEECPICFLEEQRVIEAQIRMRQQELQDDEERMLKRQDLSSSSTAVAPGEVQYNSIADRSPGEEEIFSSQDSQAASMIGQRSHPRVNRDEDFDIDLEEIMVMEAVWQSIQENSRQRNLNFVDAASSVHYVSGDGYVLPSTTTVAGSSSSPSGGLACAIAALAERQQMGGESSLNHDGSMQAFDMLPNSSSSSSSSSRRFYNNRLHQVGENYPPAESPVGDGGMTPGSDEGKWGINHELEVAEAGTSYASSDVTEDSGGISAIPQEDEIRGSFQSVAGPGPMVPESYEEQMMLAMAVSLAEARAMTSGPGLSWQ
ncbi:hypothetical protein Goarm_001111 [Gossypium armourianum]|uniref:RING/U-box superfamily protein n=1 Tax=Gossypium armourianum TaxID=34283 RepID=A0A7J9KC16_9ROSI|nr:hypothetical protein [Gossypium armourianum]